MTCRHRSDDPSCSSYAGNIERAKELLAKPKSTDTPDASNYDIEDVQQVGDHLVLKVKYPNCARCAYEGCKVMVFLDTTTIQAMRWKEIDPHFRASSAKASPNAARQAPSPAARFPASTEGWRDAIAYAGSKRPKTGVR